MGVSGGPSIPQSGLQLTLDASNSKSYGGSGTTWSDVSGNGRDFTFTASPTFNSDVGHPAASSFDTIRANGPNADTFDIHATTGYTIVLVALQDALNNESAFKFPMGDGAGTDARGIFAHCSWGNGVVYFDTAGSTSTASGGGRVNTSGDGNFGTADITHYAFTKSIDGATQTIYKDGVNVAQGTNRGPGVILSSHPVTFGGDEQYQDGWDAKMYYILVYNRELTATEVKQIYESMRGRLD